MGKRWKRKVRVNQDGTELEVMELGPGDNPTGRNDPPGEITVVVNTDLPAYVEWQVQGNLRFSGPNASQAGSVIWKKGSEELGWVLDDNEKKLTIVDNDKEPIDPGPLEKVFSFQIGAYAGKGNWLLTPDPEVRNKRNP